MSLRTRGRRLSESEQRIFFAAINAARDRIGTTRTTPLSEDFRLRRLLPIARPLTLKAKSALLTGPYRRHVQTQRESRHVDHPSA